MEKYWFYKKEVYNISYRETRVLFTILYSKNGRVIEQGCHEELMKNDGDYRQMYITQSKYYK